MQITVYGAYGSGNFGDEATLSVMVKRLKESMPKAKILVFSADPAETSNLYGVEACKPSLRVLFKTDKLIIEDLDTTFKFLTALMVRLLGKKLVFYAVGAPKLSFLMKFLIPLTMNVDEISVRDAYSRIVFMRYGVRRRINVIPDPALELVPIEREEASRILERHHVNMNKFLVGLSLRYAKEKELSGKILELMAQVADWLVNKFKAEIVFIPMCKHKFADMDKDLTFGRKLHRLVIQKQSVKVLYDLQSPQEVKGIFGFLDFAIGMRLHSSVFAYSMGVPYLSLITNWVGYDEKIVSFIRTHARFNQRIIDITNTNFDTLKSEISEYLNKRIIGGKSKWAQKDTKNWSLML